jgi:hypothetical protein
VLYPKIPAIPFDSLPIEEKLLHNSESTSLKISLEGIQRAKNGNENIKRSMGVETLESFQ